LKLDLRKENGNNTFEEDEIHELIISLNIRGFTRWQDVQGSGSLNGEPHLGTHIWPSLNAVLLTIVEDEKVDGILKKVKEINQEVGQEGIRAFVWKIEQMAG